MRYDDTAARFDKTQLLLKHGNKPVPGCVYTGVSPRTETP
jgi:hypothetical protein